MKKGAGNEFDQISGYELKEVKPWTYYFLGSVDSYSHHYGQDAPETIELMRNLDKLVEVQFQTYSQMVKDFDVIIFSDHGHIPVTQRVDIQNIFKQHGQNINHYIHLVESNYARFWLRSEKERSTLESVLSDIPGGTILTEEILQKYHLVMPDNRYGDLVFYLDSPAIFSKTIWGFGRTQKSMHGYLPDYADSDGVFLSQQPLVDWDHVELVDVLPTILTSLELPIPSYVDGHSLWDRTSQ